MKKSIAMLAALLAFTATPAIAATAQAQVDPACEYYTTLLKGQIDHEYAGNVEDVDWNDPLLYEYAGQIRKRKCPVDVTSPMADIIIILGGRYMLDHGLEQRNPDM